MHQTLLRLSHKHIPASKKLDKGVAFIFEGGLELAHHVQICEFRNERTNNAAEDFAHEDVRWECGFNRTLAMPS